MNNKQLKDLFQGITLALLVYITVSGAVTLLVAPAYAQSAPVFSATLIASTGNPVRRQYASIIVANMRSVGIDAKLFYVNFDVLDNRLFFVSTKQGNSFDKGGYDIGFLGWGPTSPVPDFRANFDGRPAYWAPSGSNYALYNSSELNAVFDKLYGSIDQQTQLDLTHKAQEIVFRDKPYNYIYEPLDFIPRDSKWTAWGGRNTYSPVTFPDVQHWAGGDQLTLAEASNIFPDNTLNPAATASSNSFYALYVYGVICNSGVGLQDIDTRTLDFYPALATNITHSDDLLDWTIRIRPNVLWQSGVEVTADDFVFTQYALSNSATASVSLGSNIQYLGNYVTFTFLNGTSRVDDNSAGGAKTVGWWKSLDRYTFQFHMPAVYGFTGHTYAALSPLPMHILEPYPFSTWDQIPYSTASEPFTYHWNAIRYGAGFKGDGTYTAVGPVGAGPYYLDSYDFTANVATLKKFTHYWNASGLEALGQFTVDTYKVAWIESKDAAIAALKNGEVNVLDYNYNLGRDKPTLDSITGVNTIVIPDLGWQEMAFNMMNPVFGTGVDTPAGRSDPAKAADAARHVRTAISHMIPRDLIIRDLLANTGKPLASWIGPGWGTWSDTTLTPDSYDLSEAASELQAAGYSVTVQPPPPIALSGTPLLGMSTTVSGTGDMSREIIVVQQSSDGGNTWTPVSATVADSSGRYTVSVPGPPAFGTTWLRANFTGYALNETLAQKPLTVALVNQYISNGDTVGSRSLIAPKISDSITVTSTTNDALAILTIVISLAVVSALVMRTRKKGTAK